MEQSIPNQMNGVARLWRWRSVCKSGGSWWNLAATGGNRPEAGDGVRFNLRIQSTLFVSALITIIQHTRKFYLVNEVQRNPKSHDSRSLREGNLANAMRNVVLSSHISLHR